jgi:hypothetical protein
MGTQEEKMSKKTKSVRRWTEIPNSEIKYHTVIVSDGHVHSLHLNGRLKGISPTPSKVVTVMGNIGPCEGCIVRPNCAEMCDAKETALVYDMMTRRERT